MSVFGPVREKILATRTQLATEALAEDITRKMSRSESNFYQFRTEDKIIRIFSGKVRAQTDRTVAFAPPIELMEYDLLSRQLNLRWVSNEEALLTFDDDQIDSKLGLMLTNTSWDKNENVKGFTPVPRKAFSGIILTPEISKKLNKRSLIDTIATIGDLETEDPIILAAPSGTLVGLKKAVDYAMWITSKKIISEIHTRLVFGIGSITLVLFAIALGIIFKGGHLLSAFGASAIPAGALIVFIMSGKELTKTKNAAMPEITGVIVMWAGLAVISIIAFFIYRKMMKT